MLLVISALNASARSADPQKHDWYWLVLSVAIRVIVTLGPAFADVGRGHANLLHQTIRGGTKGHALLPATLSGGEQHHVVPVHSAGEPGHIAVHVDIHLVPLAVLAIKCAVAGAGTCAAWRLGCVVALADPAGMLSRSIRLVPT